MFRLGYVTHLENSLNLDIDYDLTEDEISKFKMDTAVHSEYYYIDKGTGEMKIGKTYRSRLMGISVTKEKSKKVERIISTSSYELTQALDRCGNFVGYEITGIDTYRRVIVKMYDPISGKPLNDIFLNPRYGAAYHRYNRINR